MPYVKERQVKHVTMNMSNRRALPTPSKAITITDIYLLMTCLRELQMCRER